MEIREQVRPAGPFRLPLRAGMVNWNWGWSWSMTSVVGSITRMQSSAAEEAARSFPRTAGLEERFFEVALPEIQLYEGTVSQFHGRGFMALFGAPIAHEDHAVRSILAGLDLQEGLRPQQENENG